ncbi:hypothetical protein BZA70DRAFT_103849 [Myxozyma melibiosi]|uniref:Uncharacterized protein n=1 Tax=Myxozyma melibiosi TaxID=54550 RepID=A0ABR1EXV3_9ASCO
MDMLLPVLRIQETGKERPAARRMTILLVSGQQGFDLHSNHGLLSVPDEATLFPLSLATMCGLLPCLLAMLGYKMYVPRPSFLSSSLPPHTFPFDQHLVPNLRLSQRPWLLLIFIVTKLSLVFFSLPLFSILCRPRKVHQRTNLFKDTKS